MLKQSLMSLALAGTLSASQFLSEIKEFVPQTSAQEFNQQKIAIQKSHKTTILNDEQLANLRENIDIMMSVNTRTFTDFLPTAEVGLQSWAKEDLASTLLAFDTITTFIDMRLKQYSNMNLMLKNTNAPKELLKDISTMDRMSREAKKEVNRLQKNAQIISSIKDELAKIQSVKIEDFWLPTIGEENNILVKIAGIKEDDFNKIDEIENQLNQEICSKYIQTIMVA